MMKIVFLVLVWFCSAGFVNEVNADDPPGPKSEIDYNPNHEAVIYFLNVGQGDGTLIQCPVNVFGARNFILFDFGTTKHPKSGIEETINSVKGILKGASLHAVIVSHGDIDHFNKIGALVSENTWVYLGGRYGDYISPKTNKFKKGGEWLEIKQKNRKVYMVGQVNTKSAADEKIPISTQDPKSLSNLCGNGSRLTFRVLANNVSYINSVKISDKDNNTRGLAAVLEYRLGPEPGLLRHNVWLTGDMTVGTEVDVMKRYDKKYAALAINIVRVAHHGSISSTSSKWIKFTNPSVTVFSSRRRGRWNHPNCYIAMKVGKVWKTLTIGGEKMECYGGKGQDKHKGGPKEISRFAKKPTNPFLSENGLSYQLTIGNPEDSAGYRIEPIPDPKTTDPQTEIYDCPYYFGPTEVTAVEPTADITSPEFCDGEEATSSGSAQ